MPQAARIVGKVEYREGDGPNLVIPRGPCEVARTELDVTISWSDGRTRGSASMPLADYLRHLAAGDIVERRDGDAAA